MQRADTPERRAEALFQLGVCAFGGDRDEACRSWRQVVGSAGPDTIEYAAARHEIEKLGTVAPSISFAPATQRGMIHGGDVVMIGAMVTLAVGAVLCSALATLGNHAIAREFRDFDLSKNTEILMDPAIAVRYAEYRLATNIFYRQGLVLWTLLGLLVAYRVIVTLVER